MITPASGLCLVLVWRQRMLTPASGSCLAVGWRKKMLTPASGMRRAVGWRWQRNLTSASGFWNVSGCELEAKYAYFNIWIGFGSGQ
jgi:hypothetical protein